MLLSSVSGTPMDRGKYWPIRHMKNAPRLGRVDGKIDCDQVRLVTYTGKPLLPVFALVIGDFGKQNLGH